MRIFLMGTTARENIEAQGVKLLDFTQTNCGINSSPEILSSVSSGEFLLLSHLDFPTSRRRDRQDPVIFRTHTTSSEIWIDVPPASKLGVLGDIILSHQIHD